MKNKKALQTKKTIPAVCDIYHDEGTVVMTLEMPGVTKETLEIRVDNNLLIIDGKRTSFPADGEFIVREIDDCDFHQEYTIDDTIDRDKIDAKIQNGIVTLTLGIKESAKPRTIEITTM